MSKENLPELKELSNDQKDELIETLHEANKQLYKRGVLVIVCSGLLALVGTHYGYKEGRKQTETDNYLSAIKTYNLLQDKIEANLTFPFSDILSQFNDYEYYLMTNKGEETAEANKALNEYFQLVSLYNEEFLELFSSNISEEQDATLVKIYQNK